MLQHLCLWAMTQHVLQGEPLHGYPSNTARGSLSTPAALNTLSDQGSTVLHLASALGYDWACTSLVSNGANIHLQVCRALERRLSSYVLVVACSTAVARYNPHACNPIMMTKATFCSNSSLQHPHYRHLDHRASQNNDSQCSQQKS